MLMPPARRPDAQEILGGPGGHRRASQRTAYYIYRLLLFMHHVCLYVVRVGADLVGVDAGGGDARDAADGFTLSGAVASRLS